MSSAMSRTTKRRLSPNSLAAMPHVHKWGSYVLFNAFMFQRHEVHILTEPLKHQVYV